MNEQRYRFLVMNEKDNVATALGDIAGGAEVDGIRIQQDIPFGHKVAIADIEEGEEVIKYGHPIGLAIRSIARGEHVHIHNLASRRGRGDRAREDHGPGLPCCRE